MKVGIMQPYFMPYIGYFSLIKNTDLFILFDTVQFIRHGWIERNRILKPQDGWQYIQVPLVKFSQQTVIKDVKINSSVNWKEKILAQLEHYKKRSPYYKETTSLLSEIFTPTFDDIVHLNKYALEKICYYLGIQTEIHVFSEMNLDIETANEPDEWALNICNALDGVDEYWNPPGGQSFFNKSKYDNSGIKLKFQEVLLTDYSQNRESFISFLSIIDVMMFNSPEEINKMLDKYELI